MFEKEAVEKGKYYDWNCNIDNTQAERIWKDGAEFGERQSEKKFEKVKYTLKKIIETVHNDRVSEYGARLVLIHDLASECLEEMENE